MTSKMKFERLFEAGRIGGMELRNRIVMLPAGTNFATEKGGYVTERMKDYYEARAKGGAGLITIEISCVDYPVGKCIAAMHNISDDEHIASLSELAKVIKRHGARAAVQIGASGQTALPAITGLQPVGPTGYPVGSKDLPMECAAAPRELTISEIQSIVTRFAQGAKRVKEAGFDGVEIHAAHLYLLAQFLSSLWNKRQDAYGGSLQNRARILLEVIGAVKDAVGPTFPVWCRINGHHSFFGKEGITIQEAQETARMAQEAGVAAISVSGFGSTYRVFSDVPGHLLPLAEAVKKAVSVPVIAAGRLTPEVGEAALRENKTDFVGMLRALIADPELPNKVASGRLDEIRPCICCQNCTDSVAPALPVVPLQCSVNPAAGQERECQIKPAEKVRKVLVIGGGPAGMEAALVAKQRGHHVTLYEKKPEIGGALLLAAIPPGKSHNIGPLTNYLSTQLQKAGVKVVLGQEVTPETVEQAKPDAVVVAAGGATLIPDMPGIDRDNVVTAEEVLLGRVEVGKRVLIIGGDLVGCETAAFLADKGEKVTIATRKPMMASKLGFGSRMALLYRLGQKKVTMLTSVKYEGITDEGVVLINGEGNRQTIEADTVVIAAGVKPNTQLYEALKDKVPEIYAAGDCVEPGKIVTAIGHGSRVARAL